MSHLDGLDECDLHRRTPYGMKDVSMGYFSIARYYGGAKFNGDSYTYFADSDELVRDDVLAWLKKRRRQQQSRPASIERQSELFTEGAE